MTTCRFWVKFAQELVPAGLEGPDGDGDLLPTGNNLLALQPGAFELLRSRILVFDDQFDFFARWDFDLGRLKFTRAVIEFLTQSNIH